MSIVRHQHRSRLLRVGPEPLGRYNRLLESISAAMFADKYVNYNNIANALTRLVYPLVNSGETKVARCVVDLAYRFRITYYMLRSFTPWAES